MAETQPLLRVQGLSKSFGGVHAVNNVSFEVAEGTITSLIGPNGAGKSTAFNLIVGYHKADHGTVEFAGSRIDTLPPFRVARAGLRRTFQQARVMKHMTVLENVMLGNLGNPGERVSVALTRPRLVRGVELRAKVRARELIDTVGLSSHENAYAATLSGGQRKLLEFARALMTQPRMLLLDEPMAGVNPALGLELLHLIRNLQANSGTTFLLVEHDLEAVMMVSDHIHVMANGAVLASGTPDDIRADARVVDAYLGTYHELGAAGAEETP